MTPRRCRSCRRPLRRPAPDGLGPVCRRRLSPAAPPAPSVPDLGQPPDAVGLEAAGQLPLPGAGPQPLPRPPPELRGRHAGRPTDDLPTWGLL